MDIIDKNLLRLQFKLKIHEKNANEFQSFFEEIMQQAFPDFQKIRPYGKQGDAGNDGYRPSEGIYYQVYSPTNPREKEMVAAKKLKEDFENLKTKWDQISKIKTYCFVFNDKGAGVSIEIERALAELKKANQEVEFKKFVPKDLENIFFKLKNDQILSLGFDIDSRNALRIAHESLAKLEVDLDRDNEKFVLRTLENLKDIINSLNDENLLIEYEILECRAIQKLERINEAKNKYENLCIRYPNDPRAFLYLAEMHLNNEEFEKNEELLKQAEKIDSSHWLLALEKLIREYRLGNQINVTNIDEKSFPSDPRIKSNFYRLYALFLQRAGEQTRAESFIERAIHLNPDKISNNYVKLDIIEERVFSQTGDKEKFQKDLGNLLSEIDSVQQKANEWGVSSKNQAILNFKKINVYYIQENLPEIEKLAAETFELLTQCHFDRLIDKLFSELLLITVLPQKDFELLLQYLQKAETTISDNLAKAIIVQFNLKQTLLTEGKNFFTVIKKKNILEFINNLENKKYNDVISFLKDDQRFSVAMANTAKQYPDLRKKIIENLPNDGTIIKEKLLLLLNYDENNMDEAFELLKNIDLSNLKYFECIPILEIAQKKKAWDFAIKVLEKLLKYEKKKQDILQLKLRLLTANQNLERYQETIRIGEEILSNHEEMSFLDDRNKENLLGQTLLARLIRGEYQQAKMLLEKHLNFPKAFEFKVAIEGEIYLKNNEAYKALASIVDGIKILKTPTPEQYGSLIMFFTQIDNLIDFPLTSREKVEINSFVKLKEQERWYFIGDMDELDATKVLSTNEKYPKLIGKKIGEKVVFDDKYRSITNEYTIENIMPIEKYINWQCHYHAHKLSAEHRWDKMQIIEVPPIGDTIDPKYIIARLEDERKERGVFFDLYCRANYPLAFLAVNEGGLTNAIGLIQNENKGFINFSSGNPNEMDQQKAVATRIIDGEPFYIDGTSAFVLSEIGLFEKIYINLPNPKVPQSVITLLLKIKNKFKFIPGQSGFMGYSRGKLSFSFIDPAKSEAIQKNLENSTKLLESMPQNNVAISAANKIDCFSEQRIPAELCDACILAQNDKVPVLTEDFLYLKANELETKKKAPEYCSAFALVRVLYEQKKITFDHYLNFFTYLSFYRFRFLPIKADDIEKAVLGDGGIVILQPERIRQFNFPLTLSEAYGVPFTMACGVTSEFLKRILIDDSIQPDIGIKIFSEIISGFPTDKDKRTLGKILLSISVQEIRNKQTVITRPKMKNKIRILSQFIENFNEGNYLWKP
jgi:hypothetical protein